MDGENKKRILLPRYQQVAVEIAERIADQRYQVGEKIHARSTLASNFNVSPETARKAINVLVDLGIMEVRHGSGAYVLSREKAKVYFEKYQDVQSVQEIKNELQESVEKQKSELEHVSQLLNQLLAQTKRVHNVAPFVPYELTLTNEAVHLNSTVNGMRRELRSLPFSKRMSCYCLLVHMLKFVLAILCFSLETNWYCNECSTCFTQKMDLNKSHIEEPIRWFFFI